MPKIKLYNPSQAGIILGLNAKEVQKLCRKGIIGKKFGRFWGISRKDLDNYLKSKETQE